MSKVRKKHSHTKRGIVYSRALVNKYNICVAYSYNDNRVAQLVDGKTGAVIPSTRLLVEAMTHIAYKWHVLIAVLCKTESGEHYMKADQINATDYYKQYELADVLQENHRKLIESTNDKHLFNVVWLASPVQKDWDEKQASQIFDRLGYWDEELVYESA